VSFAEQLAELLPGDLPNRETVIGKSSRHLELIAHANQHFNLTRIVSDRDAAIKHVLDSVLPWRRFADTAEVIDIGTGAGFPGLPLSLVLPNARFTLVESIGKKARFLASAAAELELENVSVMHRRAEEVLRGRSDALITARAVAPLAKTIDLFGMAIRVGCRALLYKGPEATQEIDKAAPALRKLALTARIVEEYTLPDELGTRTLLEVRRERP
jgi:16S rRNA (guanine527-N7)-methyltransferase